MCGHYKGTLQRIMDSFVGDDDEITIFSNNGDYFKCVDGIMVIYRTYNYERSRGIENGQTSNIFYRLKYNKKYIQCLADRNNIIIYPFFHYFSIS